jgi:monofunctional biosynthetic peptidoglycan transglycosylase
MLLIFWMMSIVMTEEPEQTKMLFDFEAAANERSWMIVNDGVMGGLSRSTFSLQEGRAVFEGTVSLANNGGFASVRTQPHDFGLAGYDGFLLRIKGDGRRYQFRVRTDRNFDGVAYRTEFITKAGVWQTVQLTIADFVPTFRGRIVRGAPALEMAAIRQVGFLIGDKKAGPFRLEIARLSAFQH